FHFKRHWGFEAQTLPYRWILFTKKEKPNINPENPKYQWMIKCWQRLPLYVANTVGPLIARRLG
ncbi:MAG TPA: peptidoglycan bridge formation protein FemAB, partial [Gammaproteobacteria bacterium]|nr:peptidoglycan bridge formation protein FemAB [Gammaproteobacteria bacterium]